MKEFVSGEILSMPFKLFGIVHICLILYVVIGVLLVYLNRNKISNMNEKTKNIIIKSGAVIMLINMLLYNGLFVYYGIWDFVEHLPLHLCIVSGYMFMFGVLFNKHEILKITFFLSIIGPLPAITLPQTVSLWDNLEFYEFFISHQFYLVLAFFTYYAYNLRIERKNLIITYIFTTVLFLGLIPFNRQFGSNYIFSSGIPEFILELMPFLKHFHPVLILEVLGTIIFTALYFLSRKRNKELDSMNIS